MPETAVLALSPIAALPPVVVVAGWEASGRRSDAALTLADCTPLAKVVVKAPWDGEMARTLGVPFGRAARATWDVGGQHLEVLVVGSGPDEWLVLARPGLAGLLGERLAASAAGHDELASIVDLTHGRALVRLTGVPAADMLAKECGVDLADAMCPDGTALRSAVARVATDVVRDDRGGVRSYLLHCERSSGQYLFDALLDAGHEFGVDVTGLVPPGI